MAKKKRYRGHYCWVCGRIRPNERFSGSSHSRHICKDCHKLGSEELAYRQEIRNIERCLDCGRVRRKHRKTFERFLSHSNPWVREYAQQIKLSMEKEHLAWKAMIDEDERQLDEYSSESILTQTSHFELLIEIQGFI